MSIAWMEMETSKDHYKVDGDVRRGTRGFVC